VGDPVMTISPGCCMTRKGVGNILCGVGLVVHEEKVELGSVVDEESLVAGGHHVAGLLVGSVTDLFVVALSVSGLWLFLKVQNFFQVVAVFVLRHWRCSWPTLSTSCRMNLKRMIAHLGHGSLALEASAHAVVDTLWLSPAGVDAHEAVRLVAVEVRSACVKEYPVSHNLCVSLLVLVSVFFSTRFLLFVIDLLSSSIVSVGMYASEEFCERN